ncbi:3-oxoacyl-ACP reductase [Streptomyces sp. CMB-StM0423]|uniref:3-oxoacyl-ACP reductase n=1 Tax=Streptomyces sp. CMB-StM0423 TaxID=2059884 RepID=UPI000C700877|nr:3-oxoacyl-ACP reductase [Streptomyces sp. CMB-StM0423]AUH42523.1 3-oxoacyl-ACP reductase [Streptomyces sp. CMB-StM0423]
MADRYRKFTSRGAGAFVAKRLGLPRPARLERYRPGQPVARGPVVLGGAAGGRMHKTLRALLDAVGAEVAEAADESSVRAGALVFDATGIGTSAGLRALYDFLHPRIRELAPCGRVVVVGTPPEAAAGSGEAVAQRALEGFVRSVGKELRDGSTAHLLLVAPGAEGGVESTLRFALSARSAYVSGQALRVTGTAPVPGTADWARPLAGKTALVTGASRGIGAVVAETLHRDGARVVCLDVAAQGAELAAVAARAGGGVLESDITAADAGDRLAAYLGEHHGGVDVVVHNAGITRDKTLGRMSAGQWEAVIGVNLTAVETLTARLLGDGLLRADGRIVCTSSISGIAGNVGQTNYAASKAGLIGYVQATAPGAAARGVTVNAVAPGFIETRMTAAVPLVIREAGRRMNTLKQGGLPVDVAEAVSYFAAPGSGAVTGQVLRVCGQALLGA